MVRLSFHIYTTSHAFLTSTYSTGQDIIANEPDGTTVIYNPGDIAWIIAATALVWIMIPGVGFFYSGLLRRKNALSMIWASMMTLAVVSFQVRNSAISRL